MSLVTRIKNFIKDDQGLEQQLSALKKEMKVFKKTLETTHDLKKQIAILQEEISLLKKTLQKDKNTKIIASIEKTLIKMDKKFNSVLRELYIRDAEEIFAVSMPYDLVNKRFKIFSQNEEDGIILEIFKRIGVTNRQFIEIGSGRSGGNSGFLAKEFGWTGLMVDAIADSIETLKITYLGYKVIPVAALITKENINELLEQYEFTGEQDFLSIDIDGNDYWVWECLTICSPRLVVIEYNWKFGPQRAVTIPYDASFSRRMSSLKDYHGASLAALDKLATKKGYRLIACDSAGVNAFFLRNDVETSIPKCQVSDVYRCQFKDSFVDANAYKQYLDKLKYEGSETFFEEIRKANLELVEIE